MHRMTNIVVAIDADRETTRTYGHGVLQLARENPSTVYETFGFYDDVVVRAPGGWRIAARTFTTVAERTF
jgi:hypothetical protein